MNHTRSCIRRHPNPHRTTSINLIQTGMLMLIEYVLAEWMCWNVIFLIIQIININPTITHNFLLLKRKEPTCGLLSLFLTNVSYIGFDVELLHQCQSGDDCYGDNKCHDNNRSRCDDCLNNSFNQFHDYSFNSSDTSLKAMNFTRKRKTKAHVCGP